MLDDSFQLTLPNGTQVVSRVAVQAASGGASYPAGAVGTVVAPPSEGQPGYRVRFLDGGEALLPRKHLTIRKEHQRDGLSAAAAPSLDAWRPYIIYTCVIGSQAYGLDDANSDVDRRGIYLPPARLHWALAGLPEQLEDSASQECFWELQKFLTLALKANPNVLECLYTPLVEQAAPLAQELLAMREAFLSKLIYQTYNGYVLSQFRRLEQDVRTSGAMKPKHAMHLIRLLLSGIGTLREGSIPVHVGQWRESLLAIKTGAMAWPEVNRWRLALHQEFDQAYASTKLPERPDVARADAFLIKARRSMVDADDNP
ncbi:MAG: nucleotidyltransferase domain-containing protein [Chloroflexaceae bacterium]|jgi:hypothetical protein|nr:nucleotidyltransferase domain-containing protein [Chloroflexaceae bacterium]